jgi:hypothetical protein
MGLFAALFILVSCGVMPFNVTPISTTVVETTDTSTQTAYFQPNTPTILGKTDLGFPPLTGATTYGEIKAQIDKMGLQCFNDDVNPFYHISITTNNVNSWDFDFGMAASDSSARLQSVYIWDETYTTREGLKVGDTVAKMKELMVSDFEIEEKQIGEDRWRYIHYNGVYFCANYLKENSDDDIIYCIVYQLAQG